MPGTTTRNCLACDKPLHGRADKKYCNDYCRNAYNNAMKAVHSTAVKDINTVLSRNRRILELTLGQEKIIKTTKEKLLQLGFNFRHITHTYTNKNGDMYCFCYDMGYLPLDNDMYLIVKRKEETPGKPPLP